MSDGKIKKDSENPDSEVKGSSVSPASPGQPDTAPTPGEKPRYCRPKLVVQLLEAKPNKMFTEAHRALVRFLRYDGDKVACAECGKKKRTLWTMLCSFQAWDMGMLVPKKSGKVHPPLTPVCQGHLMAPEIEEVDESGTVISRAMEAGKSK